jgi:biotin operon repressor
MSTEENSLISEAAFVLLHDHVNTFEKLELFLMMARDPNASWSLDSIAASIKLPRAELMSAIDHLRAAGILRRVPGATYKLIYSPTAEVAPSCSDLFQVVESDRTTVMRILREIEIARASRSSAYAFADAFKIRKPIPEGSDE